MAMTDRNKSYLRSGELARLSGVSPDTIRFYERKGLLLRPERSANGYRRYAAESLSRVRLIRSALAVGFTIAELSQILRIRNNGGEPCLKVQQIAQEKLQKIETTIHQLKCLKKDLKNCIQEWDLTLTNTKVGEPALLLEKLAEKHSFRKKTSSPMVPAGLKNRRSS